MLHNRNSGSHEEVVGKVVQEEVSGTAGDL